MNQGQLNKISAYVKGKISRPLKNVSRFSGINHPDEIGAGIETFEKCSILFKFKAGKNFNHRNTLSILRIALKVSATLHSVSLRAKC